MKRGVCIKIITISVFCYSILFFSTTLYADSWETKFKEFDKTLEDFANVKALVDENGEYQLLINEAREKHLEKAKGLLAIISDSERSQFQRKASLESLFKFEQTIVELDKRKAHLVEISSAISSRMEAMQSDKNFYIQMVSVNDYEIANQAITSINEHMTFLIGIIDKLGNLDLTPEPSP